MKRQSPEDPVDFCLLICTWDHAGLLADTLASIRELRVPDGVTWEVLVVDNNSPYDVAGLVRRVVAEKWIPAPLRLLKEPRQGVSHARKRGLAESRGRWVAFIDDDCRPDPGWLEAAAVFADAHPGAGAFGGRNELVWEEPPTEVLDSYGESLARQDWGEMPLRGPVKGKRVPCGAGVVIRREAVMQSSYLETGRLQGRHPNTLGAGEDSEIQLYVRNAGWEIWYAPGLRLRHFIPRQRMTHSYLRRLHRGFGRAEAMLRLLDERRPLTWDNRWRTVGWALAELGRTLRRFWLGFVVFEKERPTWLIRMWYALGYLEGALLLLVRR